MIYLQLFWSFFQVGLFSIGGGYAAMPFIQKQVVDLHHWLTMNEFIDIVTISQMTPGPIAINSATFVGTRIGGLPGSIIATLGCITPSCIIVLTLAYVYYKYRDLWAIQAVLAGLKPVIVSLIASAGLAILLSALFNQTATSWFNIDFSKTDFVAVFLFAGGFALLRKFKLDPIYIMLGSGVLGLILYMFI